MWTSETGTKIEGRKIVIERGAHVNSRKATVGSTRCIASAAGNLVIHDYYRTTVCCADYERKNEGWGDRIALAGQKRPPPIAQS